MLVNQSSKTRSPSTRTARAALFGTALLGVVALGAGQEQIDSARAAIERWVETQRIISREERDFALSREILADRIDVVKREVASVQAKIAAADASITDVDRKRDELLAESERVKSAASDLESVIVELETRVTSLLARVPEPLRERVRPLSQQISTGEAASSIPLGTRYQNVVGVLNEINKFNRDITLKSEVRSLPDGTSSEVTAIYLGISLGYYVSANGAIAGIGTPSAEGWVWTPANDQAQRIREVIAVLNNERVAAFVAVPVQVK